MLAPHDEEFDEIVLYLRNAVSKIVNSRFSWESNKHKVDTSYITSRLVDVLKESLKSERELYLKSLLEQLDQLNLEKGSLEKELTIIRGSSAKEAQKYADENANLRQKFASLETQLQNLDTQQNQQESESMAILRAKQDELRRLRFVIDEAKSVQTTLSSEINDLRREALKMKRGQAQIIKQARTMCSDQLQAAIEDAEIRQSTDEATSLQMLTTEYNNARLEEKRNERMCQSLLEALWTLNPSKHPDVTPENFPDHVDELCRFIDSSLDDAKLEAVRDLQDEVRTVIPDIEFGTQTVNDAVHAHLEKKLKEREDEFQTALQRGEERERKLREKLDESLAKIRRLHKKMNAQDDDEFLGDLERLKTDWDQQREQLDAKMKALKINTA